MPKWEDVIDAVTLIFLCYKLLYWTMLSVGNLNLIQLFLPFAMKHSCFNFHV